MGFANDSLIAPAILWKNPGITKEEFWELMGKIRKCEGLEKYTRPIDFYPKNDDGIKYRSPSYALAKAMNLSETEKFNRFQKPTIIRWNFPIQPPSLDYDNYPCFMSKNRILKFPYKVWIDQGRKLSKKLQKKRVVSETKLKKDEHWKDPHGGYYYGDSGIVTKIVKQEKLPEHHYELPNFWLCDIEYYPLERIVKRQRYQTEAEVWKEWPQFHPNNTYDWSQSEGMFDVKLESKGFLWTQINNRYYLDKKSFDIMPASLREGPKGLGYTDLVVTAEAIRQGAWKVLSYKGYEFQEEFLNKFPESKAIYQKAVWDAQTSIAAKKKQLTVSEFLRLRMPI